MKSRNKRGIYKRRIFLAYLAITFLPIFIFVTFVQTQYINGLKQNTLSTLEKSLDARAFTVDKAAEQFERIANDFSLDADLKNDYVPSMPMADITALKKKLTLHALSSSFVTELALYCEGGEYLFSNYSSYTKERYIRLYGFTEASASEFERAVTCAKAPVLMPADGARDTLLAAYPIKSPNGSRKTLLFTFPLSMFRPYFENALLSNLGYAQIADAGGRLLANYTSPGCSPSARVVESGVQGEKTVQENGIIWHAVRCESSLTGFSFLLMVNSGVVHDSLMQLVRNWAALIVLVILLSFLAAWLMSYISFQPISRLEDKAASVSFEGENWQNEIEHIGATIDHLRNWTQALSSHMEELSDYLTFRLFKGSIENVDEANQLGKILGASIYAQAYQVCALSFGDAPSENEALRRVRALLPMDASCLIRQSGAFFYCALFYFTDQQMLFEAFRERFWARYPNAKLSAGRFLPALSDIPLSLMQACAAWQSEDETFDEAAERSSALRAADDIGEAIRAGDCRAARELLDPWLDAPISEARVLCQAALTALARSARDSVALSELPDAFMLLSCDHPDKMREHLSALSEALECFALKPAAPVEAPPLVDQMIDHLKANYLKANFSLQQMAFDFRLTPSGLSRYFKQFGGGNINDYLNNLKMERAKQLLTGSELPVYEIGLELGYFGPNSFIRRFKATYGITPGEFRHEQVRAKDES